MKIKTISKELREEGLTIDLVNAVNMNIKYSPVQINKGDEPVNLMACKNGFWVVLEDKTFLKDEKNNFIVFDEKACRIGRARYLINFGAEEKKKRVQDLINDWKSQIRQAIDKIKDDLKATKNSIVGGELSGIISSIARDRDWETHLGNAFERKFGILANPVERERLRRS